MKKIIIILMAIFSVASSVAQQIIEEPTTSPTQDAGGGHFTGRHVKQILPNGDWIIWAEFVGGDGKTTVWILSSRGHPVL